MRTRAYHHSYLLRSAVAKTPKKTILVTGGAGFVGSHLIEALVQDSHNHVISLDNYFTGSKANHISGATYIEGSTKDISKLIAFRPDLVYHLGEYSRVEQSFSDLPIVWDFNVSGTFAVLEFCRHHQVKIVYSGSSTKFGDGGVGRNQSPYAWTKAANTELVRNYGTWFGLPYAITYFYNVYGPREIRHGKYATLLGLFQEKYLHHQPLTVVSPGSQRRNFTYVGDIVAGLVLVGQHGEGDNFGLGAPESYSVLEIAKMFGGQIEMLPPRPGNRLNASIDVSRSEQLGWRPQVRVEDYITDFLKNHSLQT